MGSLQGIATMIGPTLFASTFAWSISDGAAWHVPGTAYALAGLMLLASAGLAAHVTRARAIS